MLHSAGTACQQLPTQTTNKGCHHTHQLAGPGPSTHPPRHPPHTPQAGAPPAPTSSVGGGGRRPAVRAACCTSPASLPGPPAPGRWPPPSPPSPAAWPSRPRAATRKSGGPCAARVVVRVVVGVAGLVWDGGAGTGNAVSAASCAAPPPPAHCYHPAHRRLLCRLHLALPPQLLSHPLVALLVEAPLLGLDSRCSTPQHQTRLSVTTTCENTRGWPSVSGQ